MKSSLSRRDFLKMAGFLPLGIYASNIAGSFRPRLVQNQPNVIIVVFDALTAYNMSLYGYDRQTTPNIARLAERAVVYHKHVASSNFTTPGTASLLTGTSPWTHRALQPNGVAIREFTDLNIFSVFNNHYRFAYSHNEWVNTLFSQFEKQIDEWIPKELLFLRSSDMLIQKFFPNDKDIASVSWVRNSKLTDETYAYSLFLSRLVTSLERKFAAEYTFQFPRGLPTARADNGFLLEHAIDWIAARLTAVPGPLFGYFHFLPPHDPYRTHKEFAGQFRDDGYQPLDKPVDVFAVKEETANFYVRQTYYDEFILYVDREFGRLYDLLESSGVLENTWLVLTSDHGEMFERGISGHMTNALYQPVIQVPLLVFEPGRTGRLDVNTPTSAIDLLPTLAYVSGQKVPAWVEGTVLPPYRPARMDSGMRDVYALRAHDTAVNSPMKQASATIIRDSYKLHYYHGYPELPDGKLVRLFDLETDPQELHDLADSEVKIKTEMLEELERKMVESDQPYL